jgi:hypothetical protein
MKKGGLEAPAKLARVKPVEYPQTAGRGETGSSTEWDEGCVHMTRGVRETMRENGIMGR